MPPGNDGVRTLSNQGPAVCPIGWWLSFRAQRTSIAAVPATLCPSSLAMRHSLTRVIR
jgi:hypothetical protein